MFGAAGYQAVQGSNDLLVVRFKPEEKQDRRLLPTLEACVELQYAYNFFNDALFGGKLPQVILTYTRRKKCLGFFSPDRFERSDGDLVAELALNVRYLALRGDRDSLSTLVHEQVHVWRHYLVPGRGGQPYRTNGYHCRVWADRMEIIGLVPSRTGRPGGNRTGHHMSHYIAHGGLFDTACAELLKTGFRINWHERIALNVAMPAGAGDDRVKSEPEARKDRIKFTCTACGLNAWARPAARLTCTDCCIPMR